MVGEFSFEHDYVNFPELSNKQLADIGFSSPHVQIIEDFDATVIKVHDGDTVTLRTDFRDFDFPLRFSSIDAPEMNTGVPGEEARDFLKELIEGKRVRIRMDRNNRIEKFGRLLGDVISDGVRVGGTMLQFGYALPFERRREGEIPDFHKSLQKNQWVS